MSRKTWWIQRPSLPDPWGLSLSLSFVIRQLLLAQQVKRLLLITAHRTAVVCPGSQTPVAQPCLKWSPINTLKSSKLQQWHKALNNHLLREITHTPSYTHCLIMFSLHMQSYSDIAPWEKQADLGLTECMQVPLVECWNSRAWVFLLLGCNIIIFSACDGQEENILSHLMITYFSPTFQQLNKKRIYLLYGHVGKSISWRVTCCRCPWDLGGEIITQKCNHHHTDVHNLISQSLMATSKPANRGLHRAGWLRPTRPTADVRCTYLFICFHCSLPGCVCATCNLLDSVLFDYKSHKRLFKQHVLELL